MAISAAIFPIGSTSTGRVLMTRRERVAFWDDSSSWGGRRTPAPSAPTETSSAPLFSGFQQRHCERLHGAPGGPVGGVMEDGPLPTVRGHERARPMWGAGHQDQRGLQARPEHRREDGHTLLVARCRRWRGECPAHGLWPRRFSVADWRALQTLRRQGESAGTVPFASHQDNGWWYSHYGLYVDGCRAIAEREGVSLRNLDRYLWRWSRDHGKEKSGIG